MIEYSHQNKIYYTYDGIMFGEKTRPDSDLQFFFPTCTREPKSFKEECHAVAKMLHDKAQQHNRIPTILLSGGCDSQAMCSAFLEQNLDFEIKMFRFINDLNIHEIDSANRFCKFHGLKPSFFDIDPIELINSKFAENLYVKSYCTAPAMLNHMVLMSHVWDEGGMPFLGAGDTVIVNDNGWKLRNKEYLLSWSRHALNEHIDAGVAFFSYTPEIVLSFIRENEIKQIITSTHRNTQVLKSLRYQKYKMYNRIWPNIEIGKKLLGIEYVYDLYVEKMEEFNKLRDISFRGHWQIPIGDIEKILQPI